MKYLKTFKQYNWQYVFDITLVMKFKQSESDFSGVRVLKLAWFDSMYTGTTPSDER